MMLDSATALGAVHDVPAFVVTANDHLERFGIDEEAFALWFEGEGAELASCLPAPGDALRGSAVSELVYGALSAHVLVGDPDIELNIHDHADRGGYFVRLNNRVGRQRLVGLTRGRDELPWPSRNFTSSEIARRYLLEVCCIANTLLADLVVTEA